MEPALKDMNLAYGKTRPKLIYVYVKENKNDRFFKESSGSFKNPAFTTLVNSQVTEHDF